MKRFLDVTITQDGIRTIHSFKLPEISIEEFELKKHMTREFQWITEGGRNAVSIWATTELTNEDHKLLVSMDKLVADPNFIKYKNK